MTKAPREHVGVRIDESPCEHGVARGSAQACTACLQGHRQDCGVYSMESGIPKPKVCNCGKDAATPDA